MLDTVIDAKLILGKSASGENVDNDFTWHRATMVEFAHGQVNCARDTSHLQSCPSNKRPMDFGNNRVT